MLSKIEKLKRRRERVRKGLKVSNFRLSLSRSNKYLFAQIIDIGSGRTVLGLSDKSLTINKKGEKLSKTQRAIDFGGQFAQQALSKNIKKVVFDRSGCLYHGRVKAFAQGAREGGLQF